MFNSISISFLIRVWFVCLVTLVFIEQAVANNPPAPANQTSEQARAKSEGCESCHSYGENAGEHRTMHVNRAVILGCTDCHGGKASINKPSAAATKGEALYELAKNEAHVQSKFPNEWKSGGTRPERTYTLLNRESPAFVRFINPGDYRVAREACGTCHLSIIDAAERSLMATGAMFWNGAAYNNGVLPFKRGVLGESYTSMGLAGTLLNPVVPDALMKSKGILEKVHPTPTWETVPPADVFRVFERGGRVISSQFPEIGLPNSSGGLQKLDEPGRPDIKQSNRGPATGSRISIPLLNIAKTRLNDPMAWFAGTNDQPGDYRASGCSSCHSIYANDREPRHSGPYAMHGNSGLSASSDPTIAKDKPGHALKHTFTRAIPSSQCMVCHMHQPNIFVNSFYGYTMWDYESDAPFMWPKEQKHPTADESRKILERNPEEAATRGLWSDPAFLADVSKLNPKLKDTQFADYHGHGWNFRAVHKRDRSGTLIDKEGKAIDDNDPEKFKKTVHLSSIHLDKGMHCVDCHFSQDSHGNGHIYGEVPAAIEIDCADCHGTANKYPTLLTSGPAAQPGGRDLSLLRTQDGRKRFEWRDGKLFQRSAVTPDTEWKMSLVKDSVNPNHPGYNEKAARAKTMSVSGGAANQQLYSLQQWGKGVAEQDYAHGDDKMTCYSCHVSWTTSCSGCHLPIQANVKSERHHYEGGSTRNFATYNPQVVRDDVFQLGRHGSVKGGKIAPVRSSSALVLSSTNINRERIYIQQPPVAASGFSSQAFAPHYPHTERKTETKTCSDCHISEKNDNNAIMAQLLLHGTNFVNFVGFNAWVGGSQDIEAVQVTEWDEPQAVIGSYLHRYAYPDYFAKHVKKSQELQTSHAHKTRNPVGCLQLRGEYLYVAEGRGGMRAYDVASIAHKGVSQRIISAPFSPLGHDTHIGSTDATCVALPTNQAIAPEKNQGALMREENQEQAFHPIYHYAFITDRSEGLIVTNVDTLADGEPRNNFLKRAVTWNEKGILRGARHITVGGHYAYITADAGLVIIDLDDPLRPRLVKTIPLNGAHSSALQFRYLFVTDSTGLRVIDVTIPGEARLISNVTVALSEARRVYVARTYAYVAAARDGLVIVNVENPEAPKVLTKFNAGGQLNDAYDVMVGSTNASLFAYVADGRNGLKVVQLTAPDTQPKFYGFSPEPKPQLIAWKKTNSAATALSKGLDRDRAVDETGGQIAVFGRVGSRPFTLAEQQKLYLDKTGQVWRVNDEARAAPSAIGTRAAGAPR